MTRLGWVLAGAAPVLLLAAVACAPKPRDVARMPVAQQPQAPTRRVETERDEFTGAVHHVLQHPVTTDERRVRSAVVFALGSPGPTTVSVSVMVTSDSWRYLRCDRVDVLADGAVVPIESLGRQSGDVGRRYVIEHVEMRLPWTSVVQIASARGARVRICNDVFVLDQSATLAFGSLARLMYESAPPAPAD